MNSPRIANGRLAVSTATTGTMLIAAAAFWLSFTALTDLAHRSGIPAGQAWAWPLIVDGMIVVATVAVVALDQHRAAWYPWMLLIAGTLVSVTANAVRAAVAADPDVPAALAACVAAVPPLVLIASTHLTVVLARTHRTTSSSEPCVAVDLDEPRVEYAPEPSMAAGAQRRAIAAQLRAEGWSNKSIARQLGVAPSTVGRWFAKDHASLSAPDRQDTAKEATA